LDQENEIEKATDKAKGPEQVLEENEIGKMVQNAIDALPADQKEILILNKYSGLTYEEIAHIVNSTQAAVKQKSYRAMQSLRQRLKDLDN